MQTDTDTINLADVVHAILDGKFDDNLKGLADAIHERRKDVRKREGQMNAVLLKVGDRVTLKGLSPKYLNGTVVEVTEIHKTRASIKAIDGETSLKAAHRLIGGARVPLSCVEREG